MYKLRNVTCWNPKANAQPAKYFQAGPYQPDPETYVVPIPAEPSEDIETQSPGLRNQRGKRSLSRQEAKRIKT